LAHGREDAAAEKIRSNRWRNSFAPLTAPASDASLAA